MLNNIKKYLIALGLGSILLAMLYVAIIENNKSIDTSWEKYLIQVSKNNEKLNNYIKSNLKNDEEITEKPYLLENFEYVNGNIQNGYVIQDKKGNQYVWVPCSLSGNNKLKLERRNFETLNNIQISETIENYDEILNFLNSVNKYGGFYIARYEAGIQNEELVSKPNVKIYDKVSQEEAIRLSKNMYNSNEYKTELINSFAWDTVTKWIEQSNNTLVKYKSSEYYYQKNMETGKEILNNIYDFQGNAVELTTEIFDGTAVIRDNVDLFTKYAEFGSRSSILTTEKISGVGFRFILYKNN